jgi:hypothetical protein
MKLEGNRVTGLAAKNNISEEFEKVVISCPDDELLGDSLQPQQQQINIDRPLQMSIDELLKVLKGANATGRIFRPKSEDLVPCHAGAPCPLR